ncbi:uncharacterized protein TNCV_2824331 [Trichonephila clavipes]|nr:uncharacterized protein TNCV_2824331 [Trichonephila clavipes]
MRSGDLFLEVSSSTQAKSLANLKKLAHLDVHVVAHGSLNSSRGVISPADFFECIHRGDIGEYARPKVREYIPNPLRCFNCQRYGHSKNVCRGQPTCPRCGEVGHDSNDCGKRTLRKLQR